MHWSPDRALYRYTAVSCSNLASIRGNGALIGMARRRRPSCVSVPREGGTCLLLHSARASRAAEPAETEPSSHGSHARVSSPSPSSLDEWAEEAAVLLARGGAASGVVGHDRGRVDGAHRLLELLQRVEEGERRIEHRGGAPPPPRLRPARRAPPAARTSPACPSRWPTLWLTWRSLRAAASSAPFAAPPRPPRPASAPRPAPPPAGAAAACTRSPRSRAAAPPAARVAARAWPSTRPASRPARRGWNRPARRSGGA